MLITLRLRRSTELLLDADRDGRHGLSRRDTPGARGRVLLRPAQLAVTMRPAPAKKAVRECISALAALGKLP